MDVDVVTTIRGIPPDEWDRMVDASRAPIFYRHAFLAAYERAPLLPVERFLYVLVRDGPTLVAGLPAYLQTTADPVGLVAGVLPDPATRGNLALLSPCWHCYDAWLPALDRLHDALRLAWQGLGRLARQHRVNWYGFVNVADGSPLAAAMECAGIRMRPMQTRFVLDLRGLRSMDDYLATLDSGRRNSRHGRRRAAELRKQRRRAAERSVTVSVGTPRRAGLRELLGLWRRRAARQGTGPMYAEEAFPSFVEALGPACRTIRVALEDRALASALCLVDGDRLHAWVAGLDYEGADTFSPYYVLVYETVRLAMELGCSTMEGGRTNREVKRRLGMRPLELSAGLARA
jgi:predicted N-acyltransferase